MKLLSLVALLCFVSVAVCTWTVVKKDDGTIAISTAFTANNVGIVAGGSAAGQPLFLYTSNGGVTFNNHGMNDSNVGSMLSLRMGSDTWGIAGGLGFLELPCGAVTNDGQTWHRWQSTNDLFCAFQGAAVVNDGMTGVLVGAWSVKGDRAGNGIQMTMDGGQTWAQIDAKNTNGVPARYASFLSKDAGYVTSGMWSETAPAPLSMASLRSGYPLTRHLSLDLQAQKVNFVERQEQAVGNPYLNGYAAVISAVSNNGNTWKTVLNQTNQGLYFNEIDCVDINTCWAVLEGANASGNATASLYFTNDGWATYTVQLTVPGGSLVCVDMLTPTFGWAGGALIEGDFQGKFQGQFYKTTDGVHWTLDSQIENFMPMDISVTDTTHAYAAGISATGFSSFAALSA